MPFRAVPTACLFALLAGSLTAAQDPPAVPPTAPATRPSFIETALASPATQPGDEIVARYENAALTRSQLMDFLVQTRGLDAMLNLMQLQIAKSLADNQGIKVTLADVEAEQRQTLRQAFAGVAEIQEEQYPELLTQLLAQQQLSRTEFDVVMATNAYLKALARPEIDKMLTDENLRKAFNIRYGEQVRVRHIQLENLAQVAEVRKRLDAGEEFGAVAAEVSRNAETKRVGGMFPPFSMQSDLPDPFKQVAFGLEVGKVSDPVEAGGFYHLIKLEERIAPRAVEFENVREELKIAVAEEQLLVVTSQLRRYLAQMLASENLQIADPLLAEQLRQRLWAIRPQPLNQEQLKQQMEAQRPDAPATATSPATQPADPTATQPATQPGQ